MFKVLRSHEIWGPKAVVVGTRDECVRWVMAHPADKMERDAILAY